MTRRLWTWALLLIWLGLMLASVVIPRMTPPSDFGFTAGMNRVTLFFSYQIGAAICGLFLLILARDEPSSRMRWLARTPALVAFCLILMVVAAILWARLSPIPGSSDINGLAPPQPTEPIEEPATPGQ